MICVCFGDLRGEDGERKEADLREPESVLIYRSWEMSMLIHLKFLW